MSKVVKIGIANTKGSQILNVNRIKALTLKAHKLQISIELDLIEYSEKKGIDMTNVKNAMNKHYGA